MAEFGMLKRVAIREIWRHEARDFTPWLAKHIDKLGEALGMELELTDQEASVGDFSLDLLAQDLNTGRAAVIENQFGQTDHDHLGKLLTYAAGFDAATVVWVGETVREEHRQALDWLNQRTDSDTQFFAVVVEVLQIDDSKPAYNFKPVAFPNEWQKSRRPSKGEKAVSPLGEAYRGYFQTLLDELRETYSFTTATKGQPQNWYYFASGFSRVGYGASFAWDDRIRVDLYIDVGEVEDNRRVFEWMRADKPAVEEAFGEPLEWEELEDKRAFKIAVYRPGTINVEPDELDNIRAWTIDRLLKMKEVFGPRLQEYREQQTAD